LSSHGLYSDGSGVVVDLPLRALVWFVLVSWAGWLIGQSHLENIGTLKDIALAVGPPLACAPLASVRFEQLRILQHRSGCLLSQHEWIIAIFVPCASFKNQAKYMRPLHVLLMTMEYTPQLEPDAYG
jgi:hypothetical protein